MIRQAARFAAGWLPASVRAALARRRFGYAGDGIAFAMTRTRRPDGVVAIAFEGGPELLLPPDVEPDFTFHFVENGDSRNEMASFMRLSRTLGRRGVLLDVGAHKGLFSIVHLALGPEHRAILVEPSAPLAADAARMLTLNGAGDRAEVVVAGAGAAAERRQIVTDALGFAQQAPSGSDAPYVPFVTLDRLCADRGITPAIVKIDVEGAEADVLRGAREVLSAYHPALCLELHLDVLERSGESAGALLDDLSSLGYRFESTTGRPLPLWQLRRSLKAVLRIVAR